MQQSQYMGQQCPLDHLLSWSKEYINECGICGTTANKMSRYKCTQCNKKYCVQCIQPPMTGDYCGAGHAMVFKQLTNHSCDVCRQSIKGDGYRCQSCDYDVCLKCVIQKED